MLLNTRINSCVRILVVRCNYCNSSSTIGRRLMFSSVNKRTAENRANNLAACHQKKLYSSYATSLENQRTVKLRHEVFEPNVTSLSSGGQLTPIIFLHGLFGAKRNWESIAKALCRKLSRRIITVDARNHGDSPHDDEMNYIAMAADLRSLIRVDLSLSQAIIVGHSMGGKTAMTLALLEPALVERLVIEDIAPETSHTGLRTDFTSYLTAMKSVNFDQTMSSISVVRRSVGEEIKSVFPDKPLRDFILTNIDKRDGRYCWRINLSAIEKHLQQIVGFPQLESSLHYPNPTLFIGGSLSPNIREPSYAEILHRFPTATISHVTGAGHWVHSENPAEFMKLVENFVQNGSTAT